MDPIPEQKEGGYSDNKFNVTCSSIEEAMHLYTIARRNLLAVNNWRNICDMRLSADFSLCDEHGKPVNRFPRENDFIRVDIPGPGRQEGEGYDWVQIEEIGNQTSLIQEKEICFVRVRPASDPTSNVEETAHFFTADANSIFMVWRDHEKVTAEIHGRNEQPNTNTENKMDNIRNSITANLAIAKFSDIQWKELCKAFITYSSKVVRK